MKRLFTLLSAIGLFISCDLDTSTDVLFESLPAENTGLDFENNLTYTEELNPYTYKNFFNGGGVGIADINNDQLPDIYFCGNMVPDRLFLNKGDFKFEDITKTSGIINSSVWSAGVSMADINGDGWIDIYVCKSGPPEGEVRYNTLYINNGDLTFTESSKSYGLDNIGLSSHASFFDYDRDGDLDCYLLNNSIRGVGAYDLIEGQREIPDTLGGNKLLRNDNGFFTDITEEAGIYTSDIGFGLGITIGDINNDTWPDIYISNDFFEKDYLYLNQQDGTFRESLNQYLDEISMGSMGADLADINNDGLPDLFVTEMLPDSYTRYKTKAIFENWDKYQLAVSKGYHHQFGRNVLQLNLGNTHFSEVGRYAGVEATDWSWGALIFDADNDGLKDIFVANGIYKDLLDQDYIKFMSDPSAVREIIENEENPVKSMIDRIPSEPLPNYLFHNEGELRFTNIAGDAGMNTLTFSNGSAYGDLDNDGDLDLVVSNVNMAASIFRNNTNRLYPDRHYIGFQLIGDEANTHAIGSKVSVFIDEGQELVQELYPMRGFQSSVDYQLTFGLGTADIDSIRIQWPGGELLSLNDLAVDSIYVIEQGAIDQFPSETNGEEPFISRIDDRILDYKHQENDFVDFDRDRLLFQMNSTEGPCVCKGDTNNDGIDDLYLGGASGQVGTLVLMNRQHVSEYNTEDFKIAIRSEDVSCAFFDANGDGNLDLYVASGGSEFGPIDIELIDHLYFGDGKGNFAHQNQKLPLKGVEVSSVVVPMDLEGDGDIDLIVGGRMIPRLYGFPASSHILVNDGQGNFTNNTIEIAPDFIDLGMITDAALGNIDNDKDLELVMVGQWMPPRVFDIKNGKLELKKVGVLSNYSGWYHSIKLDDLNGDGKDDIFLGNHGLNSRFKATADSPLVMLLNDFDDNGTVEQIAALSKDGNLYPYAQLPDLSMQMPGLKKQYLKFSDFSTATIDDMFPKKKIMESRRLEVNELRSQLWMSGEDEYSEVVLPPQAQFAPTYAIHVDDYNGDGEKDILLGGNLMESKPEVGIYMANKGVLLLGNGTSYDYAGPQRSGITIQGPVREIIDLQYGDQKLLVVLRNNGEPYLASYGVMR